MNSGRFDPRPLIAYPIFPIYNDTPLLQAVNAVGSVAQSLQWRNIWRLFPSMHDPIANE